MELSILELSIIENTLFGSLSVRDGGNLFSFTNERRKEVLIKLMKGMEEMKIGVELKKE